MSDDSSGSHQPNSGPEPSKLAPGLHLVATPIGHMGDLAPRAQATLATAELVLCEDTRVTGALLHRLGLKRPLMAYHEHSAERLRPRILARLIEDAAIALVSDAGTPLVSDPGYKLVRAAIEAGIAIHVVPGPSAVLAALLISGLPPDRFFFQGFLPAKEAAKRTVLAELAPLRATLVLFEAARRLPATLVLLAETLGTREGAVVREITKRFEEVRRDRLDRLADHYREAGPPKGEVVIVIAGAGAPAARDDAEIERRLRDALARLPPARAAALVARETGFAKAELYRRALALGAVDDEP